MRGRAQIRAAYANAGGPLSLRALSYKTEKLIGYIVGGFGREQGAGNGGKFILVLHRRKDGRWLIAADMDNSNRRPQPQPATPQQ